MADRKATLTAVLVDNVSGPAKRIQAEIHGIGTSVGAVGRILQGVGQGIGQAITHVFSDVIRAVSGLIPDLLDQGHRYLDLLKQIQLETGMTAEQTSTLVGSFRALGVPIDSITVLFARLGANLGQNEGKFRALGIATRDHNGHMLDAYTIFQNLRRAVADHGSSLLTTAAAQDLFGRSGFRIIEALSASDAEWKAATENVRRWGGVVSEATIRGADRLNDTLQSLFQGVTDIGVNIAAAVDPYLRSFVDAFAKFVQSHLAQIVEFAVNVVNTIIGFISGLFGITDALNVSASGVETSTNRASAATDDWGKKLATAKTGSDAFTTSIENQIKAIDKHIAAIESAAARRRATQERARLADNLEAAQAQLRDLRGNAPFLGGLSAAEQALAVQKHAQDILDAEKNVRDQRQAIGDFEADQKDRAERELLNRQKQRLQERLAASKAADAAILDSGLRMAEGLDTGISTVLGNIGINAQEMGAQAADAFKTGFDAAKSFLDILLGTERVVRGASGVAGGRIRVGGVVGAISAVGDAFGGIGGIFGGILGVLQGVEFWLNAASDAMFNLGRMVRGFLQDIGVLPQDIYRRVGGLASGGYVPATPGGSLRLLGEGGEGEYVIPASKMGGVSSGGEQHIHLYIDGKEITEVVSRRLAFSMANSPVSSLPSGSF